MRREWLRSSIGARTHLMTWTNGVCTTPLQPSRSGMDIHPTLGLTGLRPAQSNSTSRGVHAHPARDGLRSVLRA